MTQPISDELRAHLQQPDVPASEIPTPVIWSNVLDFEQWYAEHAFNYEHNPVGSRDCGLQRKAWHGAVGAALVWAAAQCETLKVPDDVTNRMEFTRGLAFGADKLREVAATLIATGKVPPLRARAWAIVTKSNGISDMYPDEPFPSEVAWHDLHRPAGAPHRIVPMGFVTEGSR